MMNTKIKITILLVLAALLVLPANSVYAQGPGPGEGRVILGSNLTIESGETYEGDLVLFGGNVTVEEDAALNGDLVVIGGSVASNGELHGDVVIIGGQVQLDEQAVVTGSVIVVGGQLQKAEGARVEGDVVTNASPQIDIPSGSIPPIIPIAPIAPEAPGAPVFPDLPGIFNLQFNPLIEFGRVLASAILMAFLGMLAVLFFPQRLTVVSDAIVVQPLMTLGIGLLTIIALIVSAVTIILLPLVLLSLIPLGLAWLFGIIAIGQEIGERFGRAVHRDWTPAITTAMGTFILMFVVGSIQALDNFTWLAGCFTWIVPIFLGLLGIGSVVITRFGGKPLQGPDVSGFSPPANQGDVPSPS